MSSPTAAAVVLFVRMMLIGHDNAFHVGVSLERLASRHSSVDESALLILIPILCDPIYVCTLYIDSSKILSFTTENWELRGTTSMVVPL